MTTSLRGSHGLSARRARRTKSRGLKGLQLEVGARRAPKLLVLHIALHFTWERYVGMNCVCCRRSGWDALNALLGRRTTADAAFKRKARAGSCSQCSMHCNADSALFCTLFQNKTMCCIASSASSCTATFNCTAMLSQGLQCNEESGLSPVFVYLYLYLYLCMTLLLPYLLLQPEMYCACCCYLQFHSSQFLPSTDLRVPPALVF